MGRKTNFQKRLESQNPNNIYKLSKKVNCYDVHDYVAWESLSGDVTSYKLTPEELEAYLHGKLRL